MIERYRHSPHVARHEKSCHQTGPAGLVRGTDTTSGVAVEIFVEKYIIAKMRVLLQVGIVAIHRTSAALIPEKKACQAGGQLICDLIEGDEFSRVCRAFNFEIVAVVVMKILQ